MGKKQIYEDDGHTIADMSGVTRQNLFFPRLPPRQGRPKAKPEPEQPIAGDRPWEKDDLSPEERRWYLLGALKASLLIALAFIAGLGLIVLLFYLFA